MFAFSEICLQRGLRHRALAAVDALLLPEARRRVEHGDQPLERAHAAHERHEPPAVCWRAHFRQRRLIQIAQITT